MRFTSILASATALLATASAGPSNGGPSARNDPHISDFRLWGSTTCTGTQNYGIWTILKSDTKKCTSLHLNDPNGPAVHGIGLGDINKGYKLTLYTDEDCKHGKTVAKVGGCAGTKSQWKSFIVE